MKTVSSQLGRWVLMAVVSGAFLTSLGILLYRWTGEALAAEGALDVLGGIFTYYLPLLGVIGAFVWGEEESTGRRTTLLVFAFSVIIVGTWVALPIASFFVAETWQDWGDLPQAGRAMGDTLGAGALAFYFARSSGRT